MDCNQPHSVFELDKHSIAAEKAINESLMRAGMRPKSIALTRDEVGLAKALTTEQRSGWMRNKPCPCGSGKKFKRCHWDTKNA